MNCQSAGCCTAKCACVNYVVHESLKPNLIPWKERKTHHFLCIHWIILTTKLTSGKHMCINLLFCAILPKNMPELAKLRFLPKTLPPICQFFTLWHFATLNLKCLFLFGWAVVPFCHQLYPGPSSAGNLTIGKLQYSSCPTQLIFDLVFV